MRFFSVYVIAFLLCLSKPDLHAQAVSSGMNGKLVDSLSAKPVAYATIQLLLGEKHLHSTYSSEDGRFVFEKLKPGNYELRISAMGFRPLHHKVSLTTGVLDLQTIYLQQSVKSLDEVRISSSKPLVAQKTDRLIYNVTADPDSRTMDALSIFRKIPYLSVQSNENLLMAGSSNFRILVNGRKSAVYNFSPAEVLRSIPAANIDYVEVITSPGAKYDAEGAAGIINIVMKKIPLGYQGRITGRYNTPNAGPSLNNSLSIKGRKWGLAEYFTFNHRRTLPVDGESLLESGPTSVRQGNTIAARSNMVLASGELTYEMDSLNLFSVALSYNGYRIRHKGSRYALIDQGADTQGYELASSRRLPRSAMDIDVNYQHTFRSNRQARLTASYQFADATSTQNDRNIFTFREDFDDYDFTQHNRASGAEHTGQLDLVIPRNETTLEAGLKFIGRRNASSYLTMIDVLGDGNYQQDPDRSNDFNYTQDISSAYAAYEFPLGEVETKVGLRLEHTAVDADFSRVDRTVKQDYVHLLPAISLMLPMGKGKLTMNYTKRIERPGINLLNPFLSRNMPLNHSTGNPDLEAVSYHSIKTTYSKFAKLGLIVGLEYGHARNLILPVYNIDQDITLQSYANFGRQQKFGGTLNLTMTVLKKIDMNLNAGGAWVAIKGSYASANYHNDGLEYNFSYDVGYPISKTMRAGVNLNYVSPRIFLQQQVNSFLESSFSLSKSLLKRKLMVSGYVNNPFKKLVRQKTDTYTVDYRLYSNTFRYFRQFNITASFSFGKLKKSLSKIERQIENTDVINTSN